MNRKLHAVTFGVALVIAGAFPAAAVAAGGPPIPGYTDPAGVATPRGNEHYVARPEKDNPTLVRALGQNGRVLRSTTVSGRLLIPAVALDGSPGGLSADENMLVLIQPRKRFPQPETHLAILDAQSLVLRDRLTLHGDFSFDAISPDGSHIYLIQYLSPRDPTKYAVRAYDVVAGGLLPEPIVDPKEESDEMRGYPLTRVSSPNGRWAYTLYDGGGKHPFVHALDTLEGRAVCIDLPASALQGSRPNQLSINSDGSRLTVAHGQESLAVVDTETFHVSEPHPSTTGAPASGGIGEHHPSSQEVGSGDSGLPWSLFVSTAIVALGAVGALSAFHRRRSQRDPA
jgi:DNA-binding beta-propeller fold protein YncE